MVTQPGRRAALASLAGTPALGLLGWLAAPDGKPLDDVRVRRAIAAAIDRQAVTEGAADGFGVPIGRFCVPGAPGYVDTTGSNPFDQAKARVLLRQAGITPPLELTMTLPPTPYARQGGEIIAAMLAERRRRPLISPYGVGTLDQALLATLNVKHHFVRLWGLANRVVVLDEVHAYDPYSSGLIEALLRWLRAMRCSVALMSATLPAGRVGARPAASTSATRSSSPASPVWWACCARPWAATAPRPWTTWPHCAWVCVWTAKACRCATSRRPWVC